MNKVNFIKKKSVEEIIVVEGKDDTTRVQQVVSCETIETNGSAINEETLQHIKMASDTRGVIVLTDPDAPGLMIRNIISDYVPEAKHAYIDRHASKSKKGKIGVEHASAEMIMEALHHVFTPMKEINDTFTMTDLVALNLTGSASSKVRREHVCKKLHIGYSNSKKLLEKLNRYGFTKDEVIEQLKEIEDEQ